MMSVAALSLNRQQRGSQVTSRVNYFGIEVEPELTWRKWEPGQRYTKRLVLKNVNCNTQKLKFRVPNKDVFSTVYPKTITLSAGTSFNLPVTFRPDVKEVYEDDIEFHTANGQQFRIPVKALLPQYTIRLPSHVDLGLCSAHGSQSGEMQLVNESELRTPYRWLVEAPFSVDPVEGILEPLEVLTTRIQFSPKDARTFSLDAVCQFGSRLHLAKHTQLLGVAKYPQVRVSVAGLAIDQVRQPSGDLLVDFGKVDLGKIKEKLLILENTANVDASIKVRRTDNVHPQDRCVDCPVTEAIVPAKTALNVALHFRPRVPDWMSVENWRVDVAGGRCGGVALKCQGKCVGPQVSLSTVLINFHRLDVGHTATHELEIANQSDTPQPFQFQCDNQASVFTLDCCDGVLKARETRRIVVTFRPRHPIQFYRRVACLVPDHSPLFLELLGTCHNSKLRPHVLRPIHLKRFEVRKQRGLSFLPPEEIDNLLRNSKLQLDNEGALMMKEAEELEALCEPAPILPPIQKYFYEEHDSEWAFTLPHLSLDRGCIDFKGQGSVMFEPRSPEDPVPVVEETLSIKNNTQGVVLLSWMEFERSAIFRIEPQTLEIPAGKTQSCRVIFTPAREQAIYGAELEAFATFKTQREFQIVDEAALAAPWCLTVRCLGHSFPPKSEPFLPRFDFSRQELTFPSANPGEAVFRIVGLANCGDTPILFRAEDFEGPFAVKPSRAVIEAGHQQLLTVRCQAKRLGQVTGLLALELNERKDVDASVKLLSSADEPKIVLDDSGELYFVPTNVGNSTCRQYGFKNISRVSIEFQWKIHHSESGSISVSPPSGLIQPNEHRTLTWTFSPQSHGNRVYKPKLLIKGKTKSGGQSSRKSLSLRAVGDGVTGSVRATLAYQDFGSLVVGSSATRPLTLVNDSPCAVRIRLSVEQRVDGPSGLCLDMLGREPPSLELSENEFTLPGRCKRSIRMTARPQRRVYYQHAINYHLLPDKCEDEDDVRSVQPLIAESQHLCHTLVTGVFPVLQVTDVQADGAARGLSKRQVWSYLSMDNFNVCLDSDPSAAELVYTVATRQSYQRSPPVYTRAVLDFNFGAAPVSSPPSSFALLLENPGMVATDFAFLFPEDLHVELEYWTESGEYTEQELHEMRVQEERLFDVSPRMGRLEPGQQQIVELVHVHKLPGTARLPVLMKIDKGREVLLNFVGVTVPMNRVYVHFPSTKHAFNPVPIGEAEAPVQTYELYNGGGTPVHFEVDTTALALMRRENNDMDIFECLTPVGQVLPGRTAQIQWRFRPLEPRTYMVDIPINIHNGDTAVITFTGIGFDKRRLGDTMPLSADPGHPGVPSLQSIPLPAQAVFLSEERIGFGNVPLYSRTRRIVFLNNRSLENAMSFTWHVTHTEDANVLNVNPPRGHLEPGQSILCHVTFTAVGHPRFFDVDLICEVTDETRVKIFEEETREWERELQRQKEEFTITEKNPDDDKRVWKTQELGKSPAMIDISEVPDNIKNQYKLFADDPRVHICTPFEAPPKKTLPPIHERPAISQARSNRERRRFEEDFWQRPSPPKPFVLHLGVTARSHSIVEFKQNFPDLWPTVSMDRVLTLQQKTSPSPSLPAPAAHCSNAEASIVEATLTNIIHALVNDSDFLGAVEAIPGEEIPLFCQYQHHRPPRAETALTAATITISEPPPAAPVSPMPSSGLPSPLHGLPESPCTPPLPDALVTEQEAPRPEGSEEEEKEAIGMSASFEAVVGSLLENMVTNVIAEANSRDFDITARPRLIALPPRNRSANARRSKMGTPR